MLVRELKKSDLNQEFANLLNDLSHTNFNLEDFQNTFTLRQDVNIATFVVEDNYGKIIGTASIHFLYKFSHGCGTVAQIEDVVIDSNYRQLHIGEMLINYLIRVCEDFCCYKIILQCYEPVQGFYEKLGFKKSGRNMRMDLLDA